MSILSYPPTPPPPHSWMKQALAQAEKAAKKGEVPVGAVIVYDQQVIAEAHNLVKTTCDPTAHAEILVIRQASAHLKTSYLTQCRLYVTLEPCAMCAQAIALSRLSQVFFGAYDPKGGAIDHGVRLFESPSCHHKPDLLFGGFHETTCQELLRGFFRKLR